MASLLALGIQTFVGYTMFFSVACGYNCCIGVRYLEISNQLHVL
jgi:hypothetical protein